MGEESVCGDKIASDGDRDKVGGQLQVRVLFELYDLSTVKVDVGWVCSCGVVGRGAKVRGF